MIRRTLVLVTLLLALMSPALAYGQAKTNAVADRISIKIRKLDLLNQILPVLLTKSQIRQLLPSIEVARQAERDQMDKELEVMKTYENKLDAAIAQAIDHKRVTKLEVLKDLRAMVRGISISRLTMIGAHTEKVRAKFVSVVNAGQVKAAANALDPRLVDPNAKVDKMTTDEKLKYWIKTILLDPLAYDLLVQLSK
ncbi:MAG: hypothetical protein JSS65_11420 [Armatimonadetes bacterium]|nr:hypothetical protein [Armatimonadota bacterium]